MKKILLMVMKCFIILLPLWIIWNSSANHFDGYADGEAPYYRWNHNVVNDCNGKNYEVVILGDSTSNSAYLPEFLSDQTVNLALGGTTPAENYYTLYNYLKNHESPKICYMSYADFHMQKEDNYWSRVVHFHLFDYNQAKELYDRGVFYQDMSIIPKRELNGEDGHQKLLEYYLWWPAHYMPSLMNAGINGRKEQFHDEYRNANLHRGVYITKGTYENGGIAESDNSTFAVSALQDEYYRKTIALCLEHGIQVRIIKLPTSPSYRYEKSYSDDYISYYDALKKEYPEITIDWIRNGFDQYDFCDTHHMNYHGAKKFSKIVQEKYRADFKTNELDDTKIEAILDYAKKSPRFDDMLDYAYFIKYNVLVLAREQVEFEDSFEEYKTYATETILKNGIKVVLYNFAGHDIRKDIKENGIIFYDEQAGEIKLEQTGQGIYTVSYPNVDSFTVIDGMQVDIGVTMYLDTSKLTKEFYYRNKEFSQVVSK